MLKICLFLVFFAAIPALAEDCDNPLITKFGFISALKTPIVQNDLEYCKSLQSSKSCCPTSLINTFQSRADTLKENLKQKVIDRDISLTTIRDTFLPQYKSALEQFRSKTTNALPILQSTFGGSVAAALVQRLQKNLALFLDNVEDIKADMSKYQKSRSTCMVEMIKTQISVYCLACDPNWATKGVDKSGIIAVGTNLCSRLREACFPYLSHASYQNALLQVKLISLTLDSYTSSLDKIIGGQTLQGIISLLAATLAAASVASEAPSSTPASCTSQSNCDWICSSLLNPSKGTVDLNDLATGGEAAITSRLLLEEDQGEETVEGRNRVLATGTFEPARDESGVSVSFDYDPSGVNAASSGFTVQSLGLIGVLITFLYTMI